METRIYHGAVFDFNGTLFWDSEWQESSWDAWLESRGMRLTAAEKHEHIHGRNGRHTFEYVFRRPLSDAEVAHFTEEKEALYRAECLRHEMVLAPGAAEFLDRLKSRGIPMAIATASGKANVDFFIGNLGLAEWFSPERIVFDDGSHRGKPHPDLFLAAMRRLSLAPADCVVFEDSASGIAAAENAGAGRVVIVNSTGGDCSHWPHRAIRHFSEFDADCLG